MNEELYENLSSPTHSSSQHDTAEGNNNSQDPTTNRSSSKHDAAISFTANNHTDQSFSTHDRQPHSTVLIKEDHSPDFMTDPILTFSPEQHLYQSPNKKESNSSSKMLKSILSPTQNSPKSFLVENFQPSAQFSKFESKVDSNIRKLVNLQNSINAQIAKYSSPRAKLDLSSPKNLGNFSHRQESPVQKSSQFRSINISHRDASVTSSMDFDNAKPNFKTEILFPVKQSATFARIDEKLKRASNKIHLRRNENVLASEDSYHSSRNHSFHTPVLDAYLSPENRSARIKAERLGEKEYKQAGKYLNDPLNRNLASMDLNFSRDSMIRKPRSRLDSFNSPSRLEVSPKSKSFTTKFLKTASNLGSPLPSSSKFNELIGSARKLIEEVKAPKSKRFMKGGSKRTKTIYIQSLGNPMDNMNSSKSHHIVEQSKKLFTEIRASFQNYKDLVHYTAPKKDFSTTNLIPSSSVSNHYVSRKIQTEVHSINTPLYNSTSNLNPLEHNNQSSIEIASINHKEETPFSTNQDFYDRELYKMDSDGENDLHDVHNELDSLDNKTLRSEALFKLRAQDAADSTIKHPEDQSDRDKSSRNPHMKDVDSTYRLPTEVMSALHHTHNSEEINNIIFNQFARPADTAQSQSESVIEYSTNGMILNRDSFNEDFKPHRSKFASDFSKTMLSDNSEESKHALARSNQYDSSGYIRNPYDDNIPPVSNFALEKKQQASHSRHFNSIDDEKIVFTPDHKHPESSGTTLSLQKNSNPVSSNSRNSGNNVSVNTQGTFGLSTKPSTAVGSIKSIPSGKPPKPGVDKAKSPERIPPMLILNNAINTKNSRTPSPKNMLLKNPNPGSPRNSGKEAKKVPNTTPEKEEKPKNFGNKLQLVATKTQGPKQNKPLSFKAAASVVQAANKIKK